MSHDCESCGMSIDSGRYCPYCVDAAGQLQAFDIRFERMVQWAQGENPALTRAEAEASTLGYMARMPAWSGHPRVRSAASGG